MGTTAVPEPNCQKVQSQPVYMLTAMALSPSATSSNKVRRIIQYEVAQTNLPPIPSALTLPGPLNPADLNFPNSGPYYIDGKDAGGCGPNKPAIGTVTDVGQGSNTATQVATQSMNDVIAAVTGPPDRSGNYTGMDSCTPDVQNVQNTVNTEMSTVSGLNNLVHTIQHAATQTFNGNYTGLPNLGCDATLSALGKCTGTTSKVTVVNGDLTISGDSGGAGILLVTGTLTMNGNFSWDGIILVVGTGNFQAKGGGNGTINGAMVVANIGNTADCATNGPNCYATHTNDPSQLLPNLGSPTFNWAGGGANKFQYNSCMINWASTVGNFNVIARREINY